MMLWDHVSREIFVVDQFVYALLPSIKGKRKKRRQQIGKFIDFKIICFKVNKTKKKN